eukprot:COSAG02_NODE_3033_length_7509_cov_4.763428_3_plen_361_part_00
MVINIQDLFSDNQYKKLIDDYHNKLKELFGEANYKAVIGTLHFVLTHNDKTPGEPHTAKDVSLRLKKMVIGFMRSGARNSLLPEFVQRLISHNIIVDYDQQDQRFLVEKLLAFFEAADAGATPQMDHGQLDVHANQLNNVCVRTIRDKIEQLKGMSVVRTRAVGDLMTKMEQEMCAESDVSAELRKQKMQIRRSEKLLAELTTASWPDQSGDLSQLAARRIRDIKIQLQQQRGELEVCSVQMDCASKAFDRACAAAWQRIDEAEREAVSLGIGIELGDAAGGTWTTQCGVDVTYISQIEQIFRRNGLANDLTALIETYEAGVAEMRSELVLARATLRRLLYADSRRINEPYPTSPTDVYL